jgi:hypothetical protein
VDGALDQAGATASTGGFVDAAPRDGGSTADNLQQSNQPRLTGGLASDVNVQSIANKAKLAQHSEGLTRAELLKGLSGREQAAAQLATAQSVVPNAVSSSHDMPSAKISSGPVDATRQIPGNIPLEASPVTPSASQTRASVAQYPTDHTKPFIAPTTDDRQAASQLLEDKVILVMQTQDSVPLPAVPSVPTVPSAPGSPQVLNEEAMASRMQSNVSVQRQEPLQPKLPELMPSRNVPVDTPMVEGLPGGWIGQFFLSIPCGLLIDLAEHIYTYIWHRRVLENVCAWSGQ